jgi:hypothetical protein
MTLARFLTNDDDRSFLAAALKVAASAPTVDIVEALPNDDWAGVREFRERCSDLAHTLIVASSDTTGS